MLILKGDREACLGVAEHIIGLNVEQTEENMSEIPTPPPAPNFAPNPNQQNSSAMPIAAMVCGVLGLVGVLPIIGSILGLVFANIAKQQPLTINEETFVKIAVITSWIGIALAIAIVIALVFGTGLLFLPFLVD